MHACMPPPAVAARALRAAVTSLLAWQAIVAGLNDKSALFRHEMAYVLGQMQHPESVEGLRKVTARVRARQRA